MWGTRLEEIYLIVVKGTFREGPSSGKDNNINVKINLIKIEPKKMQSRGRVLIGVAYR